MGLDLVGFFEAAAMRSSEVRCIILTGAGEKAFCAGGDLKERKGMSDKAWRDQHLVFERMARAILACPIPIVAAVNGAAYGGGCEIAACCDFIYASSTARFALP
jgi:enoyl-CoA hydratase/carnithine racemase